MAEGLPGESPAVDLASLREQFRGRKFGELVLHHWKSHHLRTTIAALQGTLEKLPTRAAGVSEEWIDEIAPGGKDPRFWQQDCGEAFQDICTRARQKLTQCGVQATDDDLLTMFQVIVLNFAYGAHLHPESRAFIQKSIGIGFLRRLFS